MKTLAELKGIIGNYIIDKVTIIGHQKTIEVPFENISIDVKDDGFDVELNQEYKDKALRITPPKDFIEISLRGVEVIKK